jgi:peptidoglycan/LPS O-acetylase OafA/YrhL
MSHEGRIGASGSMPIERFGELDLLRFFAAMSVVIYHYKSKYIELIGDSGELTRAIYGITKFGYLGVDLFFLISGFVIFASAMDRSPTQFAISRVTRVFPTFWICVSITALGSIAIMGGGDIGLAAWFANLALFSKPLGFDHLDGVYWTLIVEVKFYACIFGLLALGIFRSYRIWLPLWLVAAVGFLHFKQPFFLGWFVSPEYSAYFISGMVFYHIRRSGSEFWHKPVLITCLYLSSHYAWTTIDSFARNVTATDRVVAVLVVWALYFVMFLVATKRLTLQSTPIVLGIGGMTYPLYLIHNRTGKEMIDLLSLSASPLAAIAVVTAIVVFISYIIHRYFERGVADRLKRLLIGASSAIEYRRNA